MTRIVESKIELHDRLRASGEWSEAEAWKNGRIKEFRNQGMTKGDAADKAWDELREKYPKPSPPTQPALEDQSGCSAAAPPRAMEPVAPVSDDVDEPTESDNGVERELALVGATSLPAAWGQLADSATFVAEVEWVHQNRALVVEERPSGNARLKWDRARRPAPSYGAVNLMEYAATNRKGFMDILQKVKPSDVGEDANIRRERRSIAEIEELLERSREHLVEKMRADTPQFVHDRVQAILADWSRRHGLTLPSDAAVSLEVQVADVVRWAMDAAGKGS